MLTSGSLAALQEVLASWIAHDRSKHGHYVSARVPKMAVYGAFVSAPLGHLLISILQRLFAGRTSLKAKILQILVSNLIVCGQSRHCAGRWMLIPMALTDFAYSKHGLFDMHGDHRWRQNISSGSGHCQGWLYARDESQLDYVPSGIGIRPKVPPRADMGSFLQYHFFHNRHIHKCTY